MRRLGVLLAHLTAFGTMARGVTAEELCLRCVYFGHWKYFHSDLSKSIASTEANGTIFSGRANLICDQLSGQSGTVCVKRAKWEHHRCRSISQQPGAQVRALREDSRQKILRSHVPGSAVAPP
jgi:hypothetical protein